MTEFLFVPTEEIAYVADEAAGDLEVWRGEVLIGAYPWHSHARLEGGKLTVVDLRTGRVRHEFEPGTWTKVKNRNA